MVRAAAPASLSLVNSSNIALLDKNSRVNSASSDSSFEDMEFATRRSFSSTASVVNSPRKRKNVYTTCGRHTDQFLFSGPSLSGLAKALFSRN